MPKFDWEKNPDACEILKTMWTAGNSAGEISRALDGVVSRNAVIGRVHRMGLTTHPVGVHQVVPTKKGSAPLPKPKPNLDAEKPAPAIPPETFWGRGQCQHITGDPCAPDWQACGNPVWPDKKYCEYHYPLMIDRESTNRMRKTI